MHRFAVSVQGCSFVAAATPAQVENWSRYKSNWSTKKEPSFPSDTSARKGEGSQTLAVVADAASRSPQETQHNGGLGPSQGRERAAGGLHGQGSRGRQGAEQMGRRDRMSNRRRQQDQCNSKSTNSFCCIKNKSLFLLHYSFTPYTYCRLDHCAGQGGVEQWGEN